MSPQVCLALAFLALVGTPCFAAHQPPMFTSSNMKMTNDGKLKVYWMYNQSMDAVWFKVVAQATGYVAVGVSVRGATAMKNYDMAVGGVRDDGTTYLMDYLTAAYAKPPRDSNNNLKAYNITEEGGNTTLVYYRMRDTGDTEGDVVIASVMDLKWAYKDTVDDPAIDGQITKHDMEGTWPGVTLIPENQMPTTMMPTTTMMPNMFTDKKMRSLDSGNFKYYWAVDNGMIWFKVMVTANGWVAFGVTKEKSSTMMGFDVAVGGVLGGNAYLKDYYTNGKNQPPVDASQDYKLMMGEEMNGYTTMVFYRKLNTGDSDYDVEIKPGEMNVVWAYHDTSDVNADNGQFGGRHTMRGYDQVTLVEGGENSALLAVPSAFLVLCLATIQFIFRF